MVLERFPYVQVTAHDEPGPGLGGSLDQLLHLLRMIGYPGKDGHHQHAGGDTRLVEPPDRVEALAWVGRPRLRTRPGIGVEGSDREVDADLGGPGGPGQDVQVPEHQGRLGEDRERVAPFGEYLDDLAGQLVLALRRLVGVGVGSHRDRMARPALWGGLVAQDLRCVDLDHDLGVEVAPDAEAQVVVSGPREAIGASMATTAVGVDGVLEGQRG